MSLAAMTSTAGTDDYTVPQPQELAGQGQPQAPAAACDYHLHAIQITTP